jgi:hypothetical protein
MVGHGPTIYGVGLDPTIHAVGPEPDPRAEARPGQDDGQDGPDGLDPQVKPEDDVALLSGWRHFRVRTGPKS